jgi:hypothetical protein
MIVGRVILFMTVPFGADFQSPAALTCRGIRRRFWHAHPRVEAESAIQRSAPVGDTN